MSFSIGAWCEPVVHNGGRTWGFDQGPGLSWSSSFRKRLKAEWRYLHGVWFGKHAMYLIIHFKILSICVFWANHEQWHKFISPGRSFRFHWIYQRFWVALADFSPEKPWMPVWGGSEDTQWRAGQQQKTFVRITWGFLVEQFRWRIPNLMAYPCVSYFFVVR